MTNYDQLINSLVPLNKLRSPWDDQRWILRAPTPAEVAAAPVEELHYRTHWEDYVAKYPDQGDRGLCVSWCNKLDEQINRKWQDGIEDDLSAEDLYWKARIFDGIPDWLGEGSNNLGAMKARQKMGFCLEASYPTSSDKSVPSPGILIPQEQYAKESSIYVIDGYYQLPLFSSVWKTSIAGIISEPQWDGPKPIVAAYKVTQTMINYALEHDGILPDDPGTDVVGGHSSLFTDYKPIDHRLYYGNFNTWGPDILDGGWLWFPEDYLLNGIIMEGMISHYGPPITPTPPDPISDCPVAKVWGGVYNVGNTLVGGKTRLKAIVPRA